MYSGKNMADELLLFFAGADKEDRNEFLKRIFDRRGELDIEARLAFYDFLVAAGKDGNHRALATMLKINKNK